MSIINVVIQQKITQVVCLCCVSKFCEKCYKKGIEMADTSSKTNKKARKENSPVVKAYLIGYNFVEALGWSYLLYQLITYHLAPANDKSLYDTVKCSLIIFQNAAILEIIHAATRIVPSNPVVTALQVASRVIVVCGVLMATQAGRTNIGLPLALLAWSITEVIRYSNYTLNLIGAVPYFLTWLRYTTFIVLYPIGVTGELLCLYAAQKEVAQTKLFTIEMPNSVNFIFNYQFFLWVVIISYIPFFPQLYMHMFSLRKKVLGGGAKKKDE